MVTLIAAASYNVKTGKLGIGYKGGMPWKIPEELAHFKKMTTGQVVVMGRKTFESIGSKPLPNRINIVLSNTLANTSNTTGVLFVNLDSLDKEIAYYKSLNYSIYIIGGENVYKHFISICDNIILSHIHNSYECDTFFPEISKNFKIFTSYKKFSEFTIIYYIPNYSSVNLNVDNCYKKLLNNVLETGNSRPDRTGSGTTSLFGEQIKLDISAHCPLLTTKKVAWKTCIKELLWFLRGETDAKILQKQNVHIWDGNTSREFLDKRGLKDYPEGELGPGYGWQIRRSGAKFPDPTGGIDQLQQIEELLDTDPYSRRIMWNLYIPEDLEKMALNPCHFSFQLYVTKRQDTMYLSGLVNMRSNDLFLGNPFNIFSYYVLIRMLAMRNNMKPDTLILNIGDLHIYNNHIDAVKEQLTRDSRAYPILNINNDIKNKKWEDIAIEDFDLIGYFPHPNIKAKMAI